MKIALFTRNLPAFLILCILAMTGGTFAQDQCKVVGWATQNGGVTGGGNATPVTVSNYNDLKTRLTSSTDKVVYVSGTITIPAGGRITIQSLSGKTIIGLAGSKIVSTDKTKDGSGILYIKKSTNFIMRNLVFEGPGAYDVDGYDNLCIDNCQNFWVDHCEFHDGMDGNFDIKNMSDFVSLTWCKFSYEKAPIPGGSGGADDHRFSNLIGSSDDATEDDGKLNITFYYCWYGEGCKERMPRMRFGKLHMVNNLFTSSVSDHCIRAGFKANVLAEGNYFDKQKLPIDEYEKNYTAIKGINNFGAADIIKNTAFTPPYTLTVAKPADIVTPIKSCCGAKLSSPTECSACDGKGTSINFSKNRSLDIDPFSITNTGKTLVIGAGNQFPLNAKIVVTIFNAIGKPVISECFSNRIDISRLKTGVYLCNVGGITRKFIKR